ncbi:MAG TPA: diaminobutyrate--2-oxoglutarate transaminase [Mycobacterium sp.]|nr:diaminobutyrate--2-oxoglutarate transaminase [Mycobacterium sp.]
MSPGDDSVFELLESNVRSYCRAFPAVFDRAKGALLYDDAGNEYIDFFAGAGALNYGHNPDFIKHRLIEHLLCDRIIQGLDLNSVAKHDFLEAFHSVVLKPRDMDFKVQLCAPSGANAVEAAIKLARRVTGRSAIAAFSGGWHGMSNGCLAITGNRAHRAAAGTPLAAATFLPFEHGPYQMPDSLGYITHLFEDSHSGFDLPAALVLESIQAESGVYVASTSWLCGLRELCDRFGVLMIVDDVQVGCGRTGDFFSFEAAGIVPDMVCLSKSISGYGLPMAIVLMKRELDVWRPGEHTGTFRGNQLALVGATAALDLWQRKDFAAELRLRSRRLQSRLSAIVKACPGLALRGRGFIWAIDFAGAGGSDAAAKAAWAAFERGLLIERCGRDDVALKVLPPITIDDGALEQGCEILADVCGVVL